MTRDVLERITREEKSHAEFSWALLEWLIERGGAPVRSAIEQGLYDLTKEKRPTAVSSTKRALVEAADANELRAHGRIPDAEWAPHWTMRVAATRDRANALLARHSVHSFSSQPFTVQSGKSRATLRATPASSTESTTGSTGL